MADAKFLMRLRGTKRMAVPDALCMRVRMSNTTVTVSHDFLLLWSPEGRVY